MPRKQSIPYRNRSPYGWWVASYLERFEYKDARPTNTRSKCLAWENTILVRGKTRDVAYRKALAFAKSGRTGRWSRFGDPPGRLGRWVFEGLTSLLAIYEPIGDGAEILWSAYPNTTLGAARRRVKRRKQLEWIIDGSV